MNSKAEIKTSITGINKLFRSGNYQAALDLLSSLDSAEIKKGTIKTVIAVIKKLLKQPDYNNIDVGIELAQNFDEPIVIETLLEGCTISARSELFLGPDRRLPYLIYALMNLIGLSDDRVKPNLSSKIRVLDGYSFWDGLVTSYSEYGKFPIGITKFKNLEKLDISNLKLKFLPDEISKLSKLKFLNIGRNELENLPDGLFELSNLEELNMGYCSGSKKQLTEGFANLKKLKMLKIGSMEQLSIEETIGAIAGISNLNELDLSNNSIKTIPDNIDKLESLEYLDLSGNYNLSSTVLFKLIKIQSLKAVNLRGVGDFGRYQQQDKDMIIDKLRGIDVSFDDDAYYQFERVKALRYIGILSSLASDSYHTDSTSDYMFLKTLTDSITEANYFGGFSKDAKERLRIIESRYNYIHGFRSNMSLMN